MQIEWVDGFEIRVRVSGGETTISANREGMLSLARQLAALAEAAPGDHIHYDDSNALEEGYRNLLRHRVLPVLPELNPEFPRTSLSASQLLRQDE